MIANKPAAWASVFGLLLLASSAQADSAAAEALFERGKALIQEGKVGEACAKFEESFRLDPGGGVLINLASCHEQQGRTATAWAEFKEALALAIKAGRSDREAFARERIEQLSGKLPRLRIEVPDNVRVPGLQVRRGDAVLGEGAWGEALPVDPGAHAILVTAPDYQERRYEVQARAGEETRLNIEALTPQPAPLAPPSASSSAEPLPPAGTATATPARIETNSSRRTAGYVVGGAGVLALWVGGVFGVRAILKRQDSDSDCPQGACNARGWSTYEQAQTSARYSNIGLAIGAVGVGLGAWLVLSSKQETTVAVGPGGVLLKRSW